MLNFKEITVIQELQGLKVDNSQCFGIPLLHGTRRFMLTMNVEERERFYTACRQIIAFAKKIADTDAVDSDKLIEYHREQDNQFLSTVVYQYGSPGFQYGDLYLTTSYGTAIGFSLYVGGELGGWAYSQVKGFEAFGIQVDEEIQAAAKLVTEAYEKNKDSEKVILAFYGVCLGDLETANGNPIALSYDTAEKMKIFKKRNEKTDTDSLHYNHNFRLTQPEKYTAYVIGEKLFREGFSVFTAIKDVDKYIRNHNYTSSRKWDF